MISGLPGLNSAKLDSVMESLQRQRILEQQQAIQQAMQAMHSAQGKRPVTLSSQVEKGINLLVCSGALFIAHSNLCKYLVHLHAVQRFFSRQ